MNTPSVKHQQSINILAFDTSADVGSIALWANEKMENITLPLGDGMHSQAAYLLPMIQELLNKNNISFEDLHAIATTKGPGSFTGIRIALATIQGFASATKAHVFVPTKFEVGAHKASLKQAGAYLITLSTKRNSFYSQGFDKALSPICEGKILTDQEISDFLSQNAPMERFDYTSCGHAEDTIHLYRSRLETVAKEKLNNNREKLNIYTPYYLHNPEYVKQKPWTP